VTQTFDDHYLDFDEVVDAGFRAAASLGLKATQQAAAFGRKIRFAVQLDDVKSELHRSPSAEARERACCLNKIDLTSDQLFITRKLRHAWLNEPDESLGNKSPRQILISGQLSDMRAVHRLLTRVRAQIIG